MVRGLIIARSSCRTGIRFQRMNYARDFRLMCSEARSRGALILFEGVDKSGKSTQVKRLVQQLEARHIDAEEMRFPDRTTAIGSILDSYLKQKIKADADVVHLLFSANRFEKREEILSKLKNGTTIVMDRYAYSGAAFTMAQKAEGLDMKWCKGVEAGKLPAPDVLFFMNLAVGQAAERSEYGDEIYEKREMQQSVYDAFQKIKGVEKWVELDAQRSPEELSEETLRIALDTIEACQKGRQLRRLWEDHHAVPE